MTQQELVARLREWGVRVTPQRLAIAEAVLNSTDHPSVQQIYERVRDHFPSMTLATIYSTLGVLEKSGLIQELPFPKLSRYESNLEPHVNLVCIQCGNVVDTDLGQRRPCCGSNRSFLKSPTLLWPGSGWTFTAGVPAASPTGNSGKPPRLNN